MGMLQSTDAMAAIHVNDILACAFKIALHHSIIYKIVSTNGMLNLSSLM